jgi:predicted Ser/Thr protein kinase
LITAGRILNRYQIEDLLGQGGFGAVYLARHIHLGTTVAIKETVSSSPEQFKREAKLLANLQHPALPAVTDYFDEAESYYLVMKYVEGEDLDDHVAGQPKRRLSEAEALRLITPILDALEYLHSQNPPIIHRDIKPNNIRITPDGRLYLVDFGLAKPYNPAATSTISPPAVTPGFSPLEQYNDKTEPRSDLYALGATLYYMLTGTKPPDAPDRVKKDTLVPLRRLNPSVSVMIEEMVNRLLSIQPEDRYKRIEDVRRDLQRLSSTGSISIPGKSLWKPGAIIGVVLAVLLLGGILAAFRQPGQAQPISAATGVGLAQPAPALPQTLAPTATAGVAAHSTQIAQAQTATSQTATAQAQTVTVQAATAQAQTATAQTAAVQAQTATVQTATAQAQTAAEASAAEQRLVQARHWNQIFYDDFDKVSRLWATKEYTETQVQLNPSIDGGVYRWIIKKAGRPFYAYSALIDNPESIFYINVYGKQINGLSNAMYGVTLRVSSSNNKDTAYLFRITEGGKTFAFYRYDTSKQERFKPLKYGIYPSALAGNNNRVEIVVDGNLFLFFVNGRYVGQYSDEDNPLQSSKLGLWVNVEANTSNTIIEFDNFEVRVPP